MSAVNPDPDSGLRERQRTIEERLTHDMQVTLDGLLSGYDPRIHETLLHELVGDAMFQIDILLRECT